MTVLSERFGFSVQKAFDCCHFKLNDYLSVTTATVIAYDYIITFIKEINYVWGQPWTSVSTLTFIPGSTSVCAILILIANWAFVLFLAAADLVMILRVYAMYQASRIILGVLLVFYVPTIILLAVSTGYYNNPKTYLSVSNPQVLNATFCNIDYTSSSRFGSYAFIPRFILAALMFTFSLCKFFTESVRAYKATNRWMPNRHLLYNINSFIAGPTNANSVGVVGILTDVLSYILLFILCPRFIMSVRELYNRDTQYGWRRGSGIDSGFGFGGGGNAAMGSIRFVDGEVSITEERATDVPMVNIRTTEC
ncbi:hypothetical protein V8E55_003095 [Tylopilus felleus]